MSLKKYKKPNRNESGLTPKRVVGHSNIMKMNHIGNQITTTMILKYLFMESGSKNVEDVYKSTKERLALIYQRKPGWERMVVETS